MQFALVAFAAVFAWFCSDVAVSAQGAPPFQTVPPEHPDILVVLLDDVAYRDWELLRAQGRTPNMDALAAEGTSYERGFSMPMCAPSRSSLVQSAWRGGNPGFACHPNEDGTGPGAAPETLPLDTPTLGRLLLAAGYRTGYFGRWGQGTHALDCGGTSFACTPALMGWQTFRAIQPDGIEDCTPGGNYFTWLRVDDGAISVSSTAISGISAYATIATVDEARAWWATTPSPRIAFVSLPAAHKPFHLTPSQAQRPGWTPPALPNSNRKYFEAMVESADWALGEILADVDREATLVVFVSDNGTPQQVPPQGYNSQEVKFSTFNGGIRVPFIVAGLGFPEGQVSPQPVSLVDIAPTLAELAGACVPEEWQGQSILPSLDGVPLGRAWIYAEGNVDDCAVVEERWKLRKLPSGTEILYDLDTDPFENAPLDPNDPTYAVEVARLRAELAEAQL